MDTISANYNRNAVSLIRLKSPFYRLFVTQNLLNHAKDI